MSLIIPPRNWDLPPDPLVAQPEHQKPWPNSFRNRRNDSHPDRPSLRTFIPPKGGWKPKTHYICEVSVSPSNPMWRAIFYSGFLNAPNKEPGGYSCVWSGTADSGKQFDTDDFYYFRIIEEIGNIEGEPQKAIIKDFE